MFPNYPYPRSNSKDNFILKNNDGILFGILGLLISALVAYELYLEILKCISQENKNIVFDDDEKKRLWG